MQYTYKREADRTILQIEDGEGPESGSYPVRMLCGGIIPGMLKCQLRNMDGNRIMCYDVTSLQTLRITCEKKKLKYSELRLILENCIGMAERMEDYLLPPDQLLMDPDHIFVSPEKDRLFFAALPEKMTDIRKQLTGTAEFLLPAIDHSDREAMTAGYGFYRAVLDDTVPLSGLRKAVYKEQWSMEDELASELQSDPVREMKEYGEKNADELWNEAFVREGYRAENEPGSAAASVKRKSRIMIIPAAAALIFAVTVLLFNTGRTGAASVEQLIAFLGVCMASGALLVKVVLFMMAKAVKKEDGAPQQITPGPDPEPYASLKEDPSAGGSFTEISMFEGYSGFREDMTEAVYLTSGRSEKAPALIPAQGRFPVIVMEEGSTMIGSLPGAADAVIRAPEISRIHARIQRKKEKLSIMDLHSKNGTFVNEIPLSGEERPLREGDSVRFADISYTVGAV